MKVHYFPDTDTLYVAYRDTPVVETYDLDEYVVIDVDVDVDIDGERGICASTVEHTSRHKGVPQPT